MKFTKIWFSKAYLAKNSTFFRIVGVMPHLLYVACLPSVGSCDFVLNNFTVVCNQIHPPYQKTYKMNKSRTSIAFMAKNRHEKLSMDS